MCVFCRSKNYLHSGTYKFSSFYIFRTVKLLAVQKAVGGMSHGHATRGRGTGGSGHRSVVGLLLELSMVKKSDKQVY